MKKNSFLLGLSASERSRFAAELGWSLAKKADATLNALHVVDTRAAWELLGYDRTGFIGSGLFISEREKLLLSLNSIGRKLVEVFEMHEDGAGLSGTALIEEGDPIERICSHAPKHDLVIIGHRPGLVEPIEDERRRSFRYSVAESLAHECPSPLLVVQDRCDFLSEMRIITSIKHINEGYLNSCLATAASLSLKPHIAVLSSGVHEEGAKQFVDDLRTANPKTENVPIYVKRINNNILTEDKTAWWCTEEDLEWNALGNTLMVIPSRQLSGQRITVFGSSPAFFIRHLTLPCIMLCPEEQPLTLSTTDLSAVKNRNR
jgi:nucleotide-binding universal stress UspA family protein